MSVSTVTQLRGGNYEGRRLLHIVKADFVFNSLSHLGRHVFKNGCDNIFEMPWPPSATFLGCDGHVVSAQNIRIALCRTCTCT